MTRIYSIEFLRLLTSLSVLLYHYRLFFAPYNSYSLFNFSEKKFDLPFYTFLEVFYTKGIYGVPSYGVNEEVFWGQDRLDFLERLVAK